MEEVTFEGELFRLIPSRFPPVSVYEGLVANDRLEKLVEVENASNPRLQSEKRLRAAYPDPAEPKLQNWNLAPFKYLNPEGSRFFDPTGPALEMADDRQTALAISVARRQSFLSRTAEDPIGLDMRMLKTPVRGRFLDFRGYSLDLSRDERWKLGADVSADSDGIIYHPPERPSATCYAVLRGDVLGRTLQTVHYRFVWNGTRIAKLYAFDDEGRQLLPEALAGPRDALAA
jgi:hypothetical protein